MVIQPALGWEPNNCFLCVRERVQRDGGYVQLGWAIWEWPGVYIEAERHAVYAPAGGAPWMDISPSSVPEITERLFLSDDSTVEYDFSNECILTDSVRQALADDVRIQRFFRVAEQEIALLNSLPGFGEILLNWKTAMRLQALGRKKAALIYALAMSFTPETAHCFCGSGMEFGKCHGQIASVPI